MADILNRLLLDTKNFDAKLSNSKKGVNDYQSSVVSMAKTAGAGVLAFAGTIGIAVGASEAFTKTVNSSQTTGDAWVKMQDQMKASVDSFFASIAMGNFSGFLSNLQNVIDKAGDLSTILDNLGTKTLFNNSEVNGLNTKYQIELNLAKARNISDEERNKHLEKAKGYLSEMVSSQGSLSSANKDAAYATLQTEITKQGLNRNVSNEAWNYLIKDSNRANVERHAATYNNKVKSYEDQILKSKRFDTKLETYVDTPETADLKRQLSSYKNDAKNAFNKMTSVFIQMKDGSNDAVGNALKMLDAANNLEVSMSQKQLEIDNTDAKINGSYNSQNGGKGGKDGKNTPPPVGSIAAIDVELSKLNKELISATTMQARIAVQTTINELEAKKISLKIAVDKGAFAAKYGENQLSNVSLAEIAGVVNSGSRNTKGSKGMDLKETGKIKSPINKKDVNVLEQYQENLYGISSIMQSMSGVMGENAAAWLNWGASLLSSIGAALPAIEKLIPALAAKAGGEAVVGAASSGPLGWLTAGAAAASILAVFASLPAFAGGGVIENGSTFGDMNLARVNAGEMILNPMQQGNLFRLLNGGSNASTNGNGAVSFRIHGKDLVGVLSNYNSQKNKVR